MKHTKNIRMNAITLYFSRSLEAEYSRQKNIASIKSSVIHSLALSLVSFIFGLIIPSIYYAEVLENPIYLSTVTSIVLLPIFSVGFTRFKGYLNAYEPVNILGGWFYDLLIVAMFTIVPLVYIKAFFSICLIKIILYAVSTNLRLPAAVYSAFGSALIYFAQYYKLGAHPTVFGGPYLSIIIFLATIIVVFVIVRGYERLSRERYLQQILLEQEQLLTKKLLQGTLPDAIALKLSQSQDIIADYHADAGVIFADLVGFTAHSKDIHPRQLVTTLHDIFTRFDKLAAKFGIEKIKTIGDAWMGASGLPEYSPDHAIRLMRFARAMIHEVKSYRDESGINLHVRVGIHSGPVVAGVIGKDKFAYDLWGHTVNLASRMSSTGAPDSIQVTEHFKILVQSEASFTGPFTVDAKGLGPINTWRKSS